MKRVLLCAALLPLAGCMVAPPPPPAPMMAPLPPGTMAYSAASATIGFGGQATLNGVRIRPIAVVEDSRCPINARCVWAGRLILTVELDQRGGSETLRTNMTLSQPLKLEAGTLTLVGAEPPKQTGAPPANQFTFELTP